MQTVATLYWFRFDRHAQVELLVNPDDVPGDLLAAWHGQRVKIQIEALPHHHREAGEINGESVDK
jgi:hypothetical protein